MIEEKGEQIESFEDMEFYKIIHTRIRYLILIFLLPGIAFIGNAIIKGLLFERLGIISVAFSLLPFSVAFMFWGIIPRRRFISLYSNGIEYSVVIKLKIDALMKPKFISFTNVIQIQNMKDGGIRLSNFYVKSPEHHDKIIETYNNFKNRPQL